MKAMVYRKYGSPDVLELEEVEKSTPKANEVLIKIHAATVTAGDCEMRRFDLPAWIWLPLRIYMGVRKPRFNILGQELAGVIESVGKDVKLFKKGDQIFAPTKASFGAYAEYICLPSTFAIALKPSNMSFAEAATVPTGGLNALHFLRRGNIQPGEKVLINGAGGCIGTYAVQIAKSFGAEVTCVDSDLKLDMLKTIGADYVIDYTQEDFTKNGKTYDVIIDVIGKSSYTRTLKSLRQNGRYILGNPRLGGMIRSIWTSMTNSKKVIVALTDYKKEDLIFLKEWIEDGKIKSVIDRTYSLEQMAEAHRYVESGAKKGNVAITIDLQK